MISGYFLAHKIIEYTGYTTLFKGISYLKDTLSWYKTNEHSDYKDIKSVINVLKQSDVEVKIKIVKSMEEDLKNYKLENIPSVKICLEEISKSIEEVDFYLLKIKNKIQKYHGIWFSYLRMPSFKEDINSLEDECKIFEKRFKLLVKLVQVHHANEHIQVLKQETNQKKDEMKLMNLC
jgi:hypothetical protein